MGSDSHASSLHCLKLTVSDGLVAFKSLDSNFCLSVKSLFLSDTCLAKHLSSCLAPDIFNRGLIPC